MESPPVAIAVTVPRGLSKLDGMLYTIYNLIARDISVVADDIPDGPTLARRAREFTELGARVERNGRRSTITYTSKSDAAMEPIRAHCYAK